MKWMQGLFGMLRSKDSETSGSNNGDGSPSSSGNGTFAKQLIKDFADRTHQSQKEYSELMEFQYLQQMMREHATANRLEHQASHQMERSNQFEDRRQGLEIAVPTLSKKNDR